MVESVGQVKNPALWQAAGLRLTAFRSQSPGEPAEQWWQEVAGQAPEQTIRQRTGEIVASGDTMTGKLILSIDPVRIEWRLANVDEAMLLVGDLSAIALFSESLDTFLSPILKWLTEHRLEINRLAFGAELLLPVQNHAVAYSTLSGYLQNSVRLDPEGSSDFSYQINRPRQSRVIPDININRLTKWSALKLARGVFLPGGQPVARPELDRYYCRLELDINTAQEFEGILIPEKLPELFQELTNLGKEITVAGDIP